MKIGFDVSQTGSIRTGCGFYADSLAKSLISQYQNDSFYLYKTFGTTYWDPGYRKNIAAIEFANCKYPLTFKTKEESFAFWGNPQGVDESLIGWPDVIHANNFSCPRLSRARLVYTVYDLSFIDLPECTTEENRHHCFNGMLAASVWADVVVAISHYSKKRFLENFPHFPAERVVVAHLGNRLVADGPEEPVPALAAGKPFFLSVGTLEPRKNLRRLLAAYRRYAEQYPLPKPLVLAGGNGWLEDDLTAYIADLNLQHRVHILGYVSDRTLRWLYRHCWAFVYPSLYEGFGLPVLEAMGAGAAVITSNTTSLPEVGGDAVLYIDPSSEESIVAALTQIEEPARRSACQASSGRQARSFAWEKSAAAVYGAYEQALQMPRHRQSGLN
ncbi:glycosyltransferase family 1 protein [Leptolyngbya sp. CCNP1308]|uniref:glycosyltransferase family 4 protein n=1 Tax=Leptolyngbya sp. CCNP1308 TaxID=3110255 RepID=UPI002B20DF99|nr:glycosyltransferase family 1 protein [Leptolyngbya sp. CCNP1308]MEA5448422.1 glycosyltransferase family 1 protein [Leptolyngbya sp. CCNP1308]